MKNNKTLALTVIATTLAILGALIIILSFENDGLCIIKKMLDFPCPFCGMTRAYKALFAGQIKTALYWNPSFFAVPLSLFSYIGALISKKHQKNYLAIFFISAALIVATWIIRLLTGTTV